VCNLFNEKSMTSYPFIPLIDADIAVYASAGPIKEDEPVEWALNNCKNYMDGIVAVFDRGLEYRTYLTGKDNFRVPLAVTKPYKGNRPPKPPYYANVRQYLVDVWAGQIVDGIEADDAIGIYHTNNPDTCIVSVDKDLLQIPGAHYNPRTKEFREVSVGEASRYFWTQVLTGDRVDNIQGIPGIGPKKAEKLLEHAVTESDMYRVCQEAYKNAYGHKWEEVLVEHCNLLYILRESPRERWKAPMM